MGGVCVAGIGTEVGKTVVSAILCEAIGADYWKPVASGLEDGPSDSEIVSSLIGNAAKRVHPSRYLFAKSLSPHIAAALEGVSIALSELCAPVTERPLVVELAGGVLVPLNDEHTNLDLIERLGFPVVVVSRHYLGSINHTLLTLEALRGRGVAIKGVVFNGQELPDTERIIVQHGGVEVLGRVPLLEELSGASVRSLAQSMALGV
jgi:dethiobiotin synthetase